MQMKKIFIHRASSEYQIDKGQNSYRNKSKIKKMDFGERNGKEGVTLTSNPRRNAKP